MGFSVQTTAAAEREIEEVFLWLAERTDVHAVPWALGLRKAIASLSEHPARGKLMRDANVLGYEVRELLYRRNYRILYEIRGETVVVLSVRHTARLKLEDQ
jgi:plasmid stabilization system protein ParE